MRTQTTRTIAGRISSAGAVISGSCTCQKTATGVYLVTVPPGVKLLGAVANPSVGAANYAASILPQNDSTFQVTMFVCSTGALVDQAVQYTATVAV